MNNSKTIEQLNQEIVENNYFVPIIFLCVVLVMGILGNSLVIYIYFLRFKTYSESRFFIPVLAVIDIIACIVNCSGNLSEVTRPIMYGDDIGCKTEKYLSLATTGASIFTLLVIAIDRYLKICRPFGRQISLKWKKLALVIIVIAALILSTPYYFFNGVVKTPENGLTYRLCTKTSVLEPNVTFGFSCLYLLLAIAELVILAVLYFHIGRVVFRKNEFRLQNVQAESVETSIDMDAKETRDILVSVTVETNQQERQIHSTTRRLTLINTLNAAVKTPRPARAAYQKRIAVMFLVITIVFAVTFIPRVGLMVLESVKYIDVHTKVNNLSLMFLDSVYIINNIMNPFIYGYLDKKFQLEIRKMCRHEMC